MFAGTTKVLISSTSQTLNNYLRGAPNLYFHTVGLWVYVIDKAAGPEFNTQALLLS